MLRLRSLTSELFVSGSKRGVSVVGNAPSNPLAAGVSTIAIDRTTPLERVAIINQGIPAAEAKRLFAYVPIGQVV